MHRDAGVSSALLRTAIITRIPFIFNAETFDDAAKKDFLNGAKIAYETIITDFSDQDNKITNSKTLLSEKIYSQFKSALVDRSKRGHFAEITFIGVNSAKIKEHNK